MKDKVLALIALILVVLGYAEVGETEDAFTQEQMEAIYSEGYRQALKDVYYECTRHGKFILVGTLGEEKAFLCLEQTGDMI